MIDNVQLEYIKMGLFACSTHLRTANTSGVRFIREQALNNALFAYSSVQAHFPSLRLSEKSQLEECVLDVELQLQESLLQQFRDPQGDSK